MQHPLFLNEETPLLVGGFMMLVGGLVAFALATYAAMRSDVSRGMRTLACLVLWGITGLAGVCALLTPSARWPVVLSLLFFGTCCCATYALVTTRRAGSE